MDRDGEHTGTVDWLPDADFSKVVELWVRQQHWLDKPHLKTIVVELTDRFVIFPKEINQIDQQLKLFHFQYGDANIDTLLTAPLDDKQWIGAAINANRCKR
jgi:hypothetical protein